MAWLVRYAQDGLDELKHEVTRITVQSNKTSHRHNHGEDASCLATVDHYAVHENLLKSFPNLLLEQSLPTESGLLASLDPH